MKQKSVFTFSCQKCGACCRVDGYVHLIPSMEKKIAKYLNIPLSRFRRDFTEKEKKKSVLKLYTDGCAFLFKNTCVIYPVRPQQCRKFPYWKHIIADKKELKKASSYCRGIRKNWYVYVLRCSDKSLYTGITNDIQERIRAHNSGKGAKYTRGRGPVKLAYKEKHPSKSSALKREHFIKHLSLKEKKKLISKKPVARVNP